MPLPDFDIGGYLQPGIHASSLAEVRARFGTGSETRQRQIDLLEQIVEAAKSYPTIKRIVVWGSFATIKAEPRDLVYSVIVSVGHQRASIASKDRRFFVPSEAWQFYGTDKGYLVIKDYPLDAYIERLDFLCNNRDRKPSGIIEINVRGEFAEQKP